MKLLSTSGCSRYLECRETPAGREYMGKLNVTVTGKQCQKWSSNSPHVVNPEFTDDKFPDGSREAANNYCRNPDFDPSWLQGVWCYTMDSDKSWDVCDVPLCSKSVEEFSIRLRL